MHIHSTLLLPDGAKLAYEVLGYQHLEHAKPIVLVCGMTALRGDWERLSTSLAESRPVLVYDHRGMGDSTYSTAARDDHITMESLARDLLFLLASVEWKDVAICGFSMGGVITQELLFLPNNPSNPTPLPFKVTHVVLAGTLAAPLRDKRYPGPTDSFAAPPAGKPQTIEEKREIVRPAVEMNFDPVWLADEQNQPRTQWWLDRIISGRPSRTIMKQWRAMGRFDFTDKHQSLPRDTQFLVIHGQEDLVVPQYCGVEILGRIPCARLVTLGNRPGQVPSYRFGHLWYEYFDCRVWHDVFDTFLRGTGPQMARL